MASRLQVNPKRVASNLGLSWAGTALFSPSANKGSTQVLWLQGPGTEVHIPQVGTFFGSFGKEKTGRAGAVVSGRCSVPILSILR